MPEKGRFRLREEERNLPLENIKVYAVTDENKGHAAGLMVPEVGELLKLGFPLATFVAVYRDTAAAVLSGALDNFVFYIHSLYVHPDYRKKGMGSALIDRLFRFLRKKAVEIRVEYTLQNEDNETLRPFLLKSGFSEIPFVLPIQCMSSLEFMHLSKNGAAEKMMHTKGIFPLSQVSERMLRTALQKSRDDGYVFPGNGGFSDRVDRDISSCVVLEKEIEAFVTVEKADEHMLYISSFWPGRIEKKQMLFMLSRSLETARKVCDPQTQVIIPARSERTMLILKQVGGELVNCTYRFVKELM